MPPRIRVRQGDITTFEGDAILNSANTQLQLGLGVAGAIRRAGGPSIQEACDAHGIAAVGDAVITGAGRLSVRYIIHAVAMGDEGTSGDAVRAAMKSALRLAAEHDVASLAVPALGAGLGRLTFDEAVQIVLDVIRTSPDADSLEVVVLFGHTSSNAERLEQLIAP